MKKLFFLIVPSLIGIQSSIHAMDNSNHTIPQYNLEIHKNVYDEVNPRDEELGDTPLHRAAGNGNLPAVISLLEDGADINAQDRFGETPLHIAVRYMHQPIVHVLLRKGATINSPNKAGYTPLHSAMPRGYETIAL